jgi:hypothetical protein
LTHDKAPEIPSQVRGVDSHKPSLRIGIFPNKIPLLPDPRVDGGYHAGNGTEHSCLLNTTPEDDVGTVPLHFSTHQRGFNTIERTQEAGGEIIHTHANGIIVLDLHPGMPTVEIVALGNLEALYVKKIDGLHHGINGVLILKILIKFAISASIFSVTRSKGNPSLHVVNTRPFPCGQHLQFIFPVYDTSPLSTQRPPQFLVSLVLFRHVDHGPVKGAFPAMIVPFA